jgi:hypothetical protein
MSHLCKLKARLAALKRTVTEQQTKKSTGTINDSMCVCVCVCVYVYMHTHKYIPVHTWIDTHAYLRSRRGLCCAGYGRRACRLHRLPERGQVHAADAADGG